jgi:hypothetical protein
MSNVNRHPLGKTLIEAVFTVVKEANKPLNPTEVASALKEAKWPTTASSNNKFKQAVWIALQKNVLAGRLSYEEVPRLFAVVSEEKD